jgi:hypothetical protein
LVRALHKEAGQIALPLFLLCFALCCFPKITSYPQVYFFNELLNFQKNYPNPGNKTKVGRISINVTGDKGHFRIAEKCTDFIVYY